MAGQATTEALLIRCDGVFDAGIAHRVLDAVSEAPAAAEIYVDLAKVREFDDRAAPVLADAISRATSRISVRGLRQHQVRMLRYLGVDPSALDPGLAPRPDATALDLRHDAPRGAR